ncbi:MAG: molybdenum ABC transporter ATP-binding protein [Kiloniellaceae bacterium]
MLEVDLSEPLDGFSLEAKIATQCAGITVVFGDSGSGKTALLTLLAGLRRPAGGRIVVAGEVVFDSAAGIDLPPQRRRFGCLFPEDRLFPHLTVRGNLCFGQRRAPAAERRADLERVAGLLGLAELLDRRPAALGPGARQRVALGRALLAGPRLLLMDEPLAALDPGEAEELLACLERLRDELALPMVYATTALPQALRLADNLAILAAGQIAAAGPPEQVMARLDLPVLAARPDAGAVIAATVAGQDKMFGLTELRFAGGRLRVPHLDLPLGRSLRLHIAARDVAVAYTPPENTSILNIIPCVIEAIGEEKSPQVELRLEAGGAILRARVTARSRAALGLRPGLPVYALVKAVSLAGAARIGVSGK